MLRQSLYFLTSLVVSASCIGCKSKQTEEFAQKQAQLSNQLVAAHKSYVKEEAAIIDTFLVQKNLKLQQTPTGLRYKIYSSSNGYTPVNGDEVTATYHLYLLNDKLCQSNNQMRFTVGMADIPTGLHELVQLMHAGDSAHAVLPVHLAYGLSGDANIPPESTLFCTFKINNIKQNQINNSKK
ncbi:MAG: FKBP-type peptidyl-prolyl cis-trans isomerase [Bacteroidia bacterium]|nr:FKBP-type peptidyl-prolyl cis-trans isomerase [Bacteroidia bacterium]HQV01448.1 FKBP-type peptidyl-prolyl cis-trans isomerase [Bacteroidia bacterium]